MIIFPARDFEVGGQTLTCNRAAVFMLAVDLAERPGSPGLRCDVAYGEEQKGLFRTLGYEFGRLVKPHFVGPEKHAEYRRRAKHGALKLRGRDLIESLVLWMEEQLVADGHFGKEASVVDVVAGEELPG